MRRIMRNRFALLTLSLALLMGLAGPQSAWAHGGEDHGDEKKPDAVAAGGNMVARTVRVGDFEVTIKHPNVEPDKEALARVFVTRFATNEPVKNAKITLRLEGSGGTPVEAAATPTATAGLYEVKLPPMPQGERQLSARVEIDGTQATTSYGTMQIAMSETASVAAVSSWARTALMILGLMLVLALVGAGLYFAAPYFRRHRVRGDAATA